MKHRHLAVPKGTPAERLPSAAIVDLLERGEIEDWRPLLRAVQRDPFGPLAERILRLISEYPHYGTTPLWREWIYRRRDLAEAQGSVRDSLAPASLRRRLGLTQTQVARRLGMSQSDLSKFEHRRDVRVSTLAEYARALGGRLESVFDREGNRVRLRLPGRRRPVKRR